MRESVAAVVGFVAASVFPPVVLSFGWPLSGRFDIVSAAIGVVVLYPFSAAFTFLLGVPAFLLLRRFAPGRWWAVLAVGFVLGILVSIAMRLPSRPDPRDFLVDGPLAAGSALIFWLIWRRSVGK
jgi:hypothetical protein